MAQPQQRDWTDDIDLSYEANETNAKQGDYYVEGFGAAAPVEDAPPADTASSRASTPTEILDEDDMGLRERASAYKAMWRDTAGRRRRRCASPKRAAASRRAVAFFPATTAPPRPVDFELPYGLLVEAAKERAAERARKAGVRSLDVAFAEFELVKRNVFAHRAERVWRTVEDADGGRCGCDKACEFVELDDDGDDRDDDPERRGRSGCFAACPSRASFIECTPLTCSLGKRCANRRLQRINAATGVEVMPARRYAELRNSRDEKHSYFMALGKGDVIDASRYGGLTRFLNHSCAPNCEAESWMVNGEMRVAIAALRDVAKDEEITFDYSWSSGDARTAAQPSKVSSDRRCRCGAPNCRGVLGDRGDRAEPGARSRAAAVAGGPRKRPARSVPEGKALEPAKRAVVRAGFCREDGDAVERASTRGGGAATPSRPAPAMPAAASFAAFLALDDAGREALEPRPDEPEWTKRLLAAA
ncbi:hypothetical protein JL721_10287 [Aureococcus anophagefferens]|nr:hypothetical protein JL721_10287 [Aureococcus anophagefferens]